MPTRPSKAVFTHQKEKVSKVDMAVKETKMATESLKGAKSLMKEASVLKKSDTKGAIRKMESAAKMCEKGMKSVSPTKHGHAGVHADLEKLHEDITNTVVRWSKESKVKKEIHKDVILKGQELKPNMGHVVPSSRRNDIIKVVDSFVEAIHTHKDKSVSGLVKDLTKFSDAFEKGEMKKTVGRTAKTMPYGFEDYRKDCLNAIEEHKKAHVKLHKKQPNGLFEHIGNAARAMMRLLVKMFNYVTGYKSGMFKKPDSDLGKEARAFNKALVDLKEHEPKMDHKAQPK